MRLSTRDGSDAYDPVAGGRRKVWVMVAAGTAAVAAVVLFLPGPGTPPGPVNATSTTAPATSTPGQRSTAPAATPGSPATTAAPPVIPDTQTTTPDTAGQAQAAAVGFVAGWLHRGPVPERVELLRPVTSPAAVDAYATVPLDVLPPDGPVTVTATTSDGYTATVTASLADGTVVQITLTASTDGWRAVDVTPVR